MRQSTLSYLRRNMVLDSSISLSRIAHTHILENRPISELDSAISRFRPFTSPHRKPVIFTSWAVNIFLWRIRCQNNIWSAVHHLFAAFWTSYTVWFWQSIIFLPTGDFAFPICIVLLKGFHDFRCFSLFSFIPRLSGASRLAKRYARGWLYLGIAPNRQPMEQSPTP